MFPKRRGPAGSLPPADLQPVVVALSKVDLLQGETEERLRSLAFCVRVVEPPPGTTIVREGHLPKAFFVVRSGRLDVFSSGEYGKPEEKVNEIRENGHFGEIGLIEGMPSTATVRTRGQACLYRISGRDFLEFIRDSPFGTASFSNTIETTLARTHPSYRPAVSGGTGPPSPLPEGLARAIAQECSARGLDWAAWDSAMSLGAAEVLADYLSAPPGIRAEIAELLRSRRDV